jgi:hypothetical protein
LIKDSRQTFLSFTHNPQPTTNGTVTSNLHKVFTKPNNVSIAMRYTHGKYIANKPQEQDAKPLIVTPPLQRSGEGKRSSGKFTNLLERYILLLTNHVKAGIKRKQLRHRRQATA